MTKERRSKRPIGELLVAEELITQGELLDALANRTVIDGRRERLGETIVRLGFVHGRDMARVVAAQLDLEFVGDEVPTPDAGVRDVISEDLARRLRIAPLRLEDDVLVVLAADPSDAAASEEVLEASGKPDVRILVGDGEQVSWALSSLYGDEDPGPQPAWAQPDGGADAGQQAGGDPQQQPPAVADGRLDTASQDTFQMVAAESLLADLRQPARPMATDPTWAAITDRTPGTHMPGTVAGQGHRTPAATGAQAHAATRPSDPLQAGGAVSALVTSALAAEATAIHLTPGPHGTVVAHRVDGTLRAGPAMEGLTHEEVVREVHRAAGLPATTDGRPLSGRTTVEVDGLPVVLDVRCLPGASGEALHIDLTAGHVPPRDLDALGLDPDDLDAVRRAVERPGALVLVAGPRRSGRTTTLGAILSHLADGTRGAVAVGHPDLPEVPAVTRLLGSDAATRAGLASAALDTDADVVGLDDVDTPVAAGLAVAAARSGRTVVATLHATDAADALDRLGHLAGDARAARLVTLVLAVRLARRPCVACTEAHRASDEERALLGVADGGWVSGQGCDACGGTGHRGRLPLVEVMAVDADIVHAAVAADPDGIRAAARRAGVRSLRTRALARAEAGETSLGEVLRVTVPDPGPAVEVPQTTGHAPAPAAASGQTTPSPDLALPRRIPGREDASAAASMFSSERTRAADTVQEHPDPPPARTDEPPAPSPEKALADARTRLEEMLQGVK